MPPLTTSGLSFARNAMWHIEIQKGQFEDIQKSSQEQAEAKGRLLQGQAAQQLRQEKEALGKAERNQLLRVR